MSRVTARGRLVAAVVAVAALAGALAACGVAENDEPHAIPVEQVPPGLLDANPSTSTSAPTPTEQAVTVYYLVQQGGTVRLFGVTREVANANRPRDRILAVLSPPTPEEAQANILTSIPADTHLLDTELSANGELTIDLSRSLFDIQGQELRNAFAQLVWTATELPTVRLVRIRVGGEEFPAPNEAGVEQRGGVDRQDYLTLAPG